MAEILLTDASVEIPVFDYSARKLFGSFRGRKADEAAGISTSSVAAVRQINLHILPGDRVGLVGNNGAGKSTLLRMIAGIYRPSSGSIRVEGRRSSLLDITFGIEPDLTGRESILLRAQVLGIPTKRARESVDEILDFADLGRFSDLPTRTYSSGMYVRLAFAIATILTPDILIMDEWLTVGDESFRAKAEARLKAIVAATPILVVASHSRQLIEAVCSTVVWLEDGIVRQVGNPSEICPQYFG